MVDRLARLAGRVSPVASVALLVSAAVWLMLTSLYAPAAQAAWLLAAGMAAALFAVVVACYSAVRVLLRG